MGLAVQIVLDKEVSPLLEVEAAVVAHEAVWMVELVPGLHDGATAQRQEEQQNPLEENRISEDRWRLSS